MAVRVGWCTANTHCSELLFEEPEVVRVNVPCPVIGSWASQTFLLRAPYDMTVSLELGPQGPMLAWGDPAPNAETHAVWSFARPNSWARADRPVLNWNIDHLFLADETVILETTAPFYHMDGVDWPGVMLPTRFDIRAWTRPVPWSFEWRDLSRPLRIRRGDPIQYIRLHTKRQDETFRLRRVDYTEEMHAAIERCRKLGPFRRGLGGIGERLLRLRPRRWLS